MCSLQEAWNDFPLTKSSQNTNSVENDKMKLVREQQIKMDMNNNQNNLNNQRQQMDREITVKQFDRVPETGYYSQSDDRRQFSQHDNDIFRPEYDNNLLQKPPSGNSHGDTIRGVHNKFTRTKRIPTMTGGNNTINLSSSVNNPKPLPKTLNNIPAYVREFGSVDNKPYREGKSNGLSLPDTGPMAHNLDEVDESFVSLDSNYFNNNYIDSMDNSETYPQPNTSHSNSSHSNSSQYNSSHSNSSQPNTSQSNFEQSNSEQSNSEQSNIQYINNVDNEVGKNKLNMEQINLLKKQIQSLYVKINMLETKLHSVENNRPHDIILIIVISLFILFIVDNVFKLSIKF